MTHFYTKYSKNGASSRVRTFQNISDESLAFPFFDTSYLEMKYKGKFSLKLILKCYWGRVKSLIKNDDNTNYVEKEFFPYCPFFIEFALLKLFGIVGKNRKLILDIDDAIFVNYKKSALLKFFLRNKIENLIKISNIVICGSTTLLEYCEAYNENCILIPSSYDNPGNIKHVPYTFPLKIGWIGTPNTQKYLGEFFGRFPSEYADLFEFYLIGANETILRDINENMNVQVLDWSIGSEANLLDQLHYGIMPISKTPFEYFKCGYKIIQYFAHAKPAIATSHGENVNIISHGVDGFLITEDNFICFQNIVEMSEFEYQAMCENARKKYLKGYDFHKIRRKFQEITY